MNEPDDFVRMLEGERCGALLAQELWRSGEPSDLVNVLFVRVGSGRWVRFYFDAGAFFWRPAAPEPVTGGEPRWEFRLADVGARFGVTGQRIERVRFAQPDPGAARLSIALERGTLVLDHADDHSRLVFVAAAA